MPKNKILILFLLISIFPFVHAQCGQGQVDINSASLDELDQLTGIGPAKGQAIIDTRPYETLDDLINVYGIGEITLQKIKDQGLACVEGSSQTTTQQEDPEEPEEEIEEPEETEPEEEEENKDIFYAEEPKETQGEKEEQNDPIRLTPQTIKSESSSDENKPLNKVYYIIGFGLLLCFLFLLDKKNNKKKNEFN